MKKRALIIILCAAAAAVVVLLICAAQLDLSPDSDFSVTLETDGSHVKSWQSDDGSYYLFLPHSVSIPDLSFSCEGIRVKNVSSGTYDSKTHTVSGAFQKSGDTLTITSRNRQTYELTVMQTDLPDIMIDLTEDTSLDEINGGLKETRYEGNTAILIDRDGTADPQTDVTIKGRGNSTWSFATKKSYQIRFSEKIPVFGMEPSKKWILQANAFDETMMRNQIAFQASRDLGMAYTPEYVYTNVWVDGEYIGVYTVGESVEIGKGKLELEDPEGIVAELDSAYYMDNDYWFETEIDNFGVKETVSEEDADINAGIVDFRAKYEGLWNYLNETESTEVTLEGISQYIDVDSFVKMFFLLEFYRNTDAYITSTYFYQDGADDVIRFGPVWDYDCSMGSSSSESLASPEGTDYLRGAVITKLMDTPAFSRYAAEYYDYNKEKFEYSLQYCEDLYKQLAPSAEMNYTRWEHALGGSHTAEYDVKHDIAAFHESYSAGCEYLKEWLKTRLEVFAPAAAG